jgi:hypothetical protein
MLRVEYLETSVKTIIFIPINFSYMCYRPSRVVSRCDFPQATENTGLVIKLVRFGKYDVLSSGIIVVWNVNGLPSYTARCTPKLNQKKKIQLVI